MASKVNVDDDKYMKSTSKGDLPSSHSNSDQDYVKMPVYVFKFACFVLVSFAAFAQTGLLKFDFIGYERFVVLQVEILGLVMLREKIQAQKTVSGMSRTTFLMYAAVYLCRTWLGIWDLPWLLMYSESPASIVLAEVGLDPVLGFFSFLLVLDILKSIFVTHRKTYDADLDVLKAWHLIPACLVMGLLVHIDFPEFTFLWKYCFTATLYMDVLALMPQVVLMAMSGGKVATPVAHFVAATAISRCGDLTHTVFSAWQEIDKLTAAGYDVAGLNPSSWFIIIVQIVHLVLVADFMFYYCKSRNWAADKESDELTLWV